MEGGRITYHKIESISYESLEIYGLFLGSILFFGGLSKATFNDMKR